MKSFLSAFILIISFHTHAQQKNCEFDLEEKTDSTYFKKTPDYLIHEKDVTSTKDFVFFSLVNSDGTPYLNFQLLQKSNDFIRSNCFDNNSKISLQLTNGKIVTLLSAGEVCNQMIYNEKEKKNIRLLNNYFLFSKDAYEELKKYPVSLMKVNFVAETIDYVFKKEIKSATIKGEYYPETYFMDFLKCVE